MSNAFVQWSTRLILTPALIAACAATNGRPAIAGAAELNMVLVFDGLRPDSITPGETPNLWRLRQEGVNFVDSDPTSPKVDNGSSE
jgi:hypothetical protein